MEPLRSTAPDDGFASDDELMQSKCLGRSGFILMGIVSAYAGATLWAGRGGWRLALTSISTGDILISSALSRSVFCCARLGGTITSACCNGTFPCCIVS